MCSSHCWSTVCWAQTLSLQAEQCLKLNCQSGPSFAGSFFFLMTFVLVSCPQPKGLLGGRVNLCTESCLRTSLGSALPHFPSLKCQTVYSLLLSQLSRPGLRTSPCLSCVPHVLASSQLCYLRECSYGSLIISNQKTELCHLVLCLCPALPSCVRDHTALYP